MVVKVAGLGRSFVGVTAYCLHDRREPGEPQPETDERVEWTDTRNLSTSRGERAAAVMAATALAAPELKRLAGGSPGGRKLEKPVCHYSLNWAKDETPDRQEMSRAVDESLKALGLERHQTLIVAHRDTEHRHVHVIVNRVDLESGRAAGLSKSKLRLSKWAEGYEQAQGRIRCEKRVTNNTRRSRGERVQDRVSLPTARYRRERMHPDREPRKTIPPGRDLEERRKVAWLRWQEDAMWRSWQERKLGELERRCGREWSEVYARQDQQRAQLADTWRGRWGRLRMWREGRRRLRELGAHLRGRPEALRRWQEDLERYHKRERAQLAKLHHKASGEIARPAGEQYRSAMEGLGEKWASERVEFALRHPDMTKQMAESVLAQAREVGGEPEYQRQKQEQSAAEIAREKAKWAETVRQWEQAEADKAARAAEIARLLERQRIERDRGRGFER